MYSSNHHFASGTKFTVYLCQTARKSKELCDQTQISDITVGEFVFNFFANMINAKGDGIADKETMQQRLLRGSAFRYVDIEPDSLDDLMSLIGSGKDGAMFRPVQPEIQITNSAESLIEQKKKLERALQRLTDLYLFSEAEMSERDYVVRKGKLEEQLQSIEANITAIESSVPNTQTEELIAAAGSFIIAQSMKGRNYISFRHLLDTVDARLLSDFVHAIIQTVYVLDREVTAIEFCNGLYIRFTRKRPEG